MFGTVTRYFNDKGYGFIRGEDDVSNLVPTCLPCNRFKSNIAPALFEERIREIFMYQMEKKFSDKWIWCFVKEILEILI